MVNTVRNLLADHLQHPSNSVNLLLKEEPHHLHLQHHLQYHRPPPLHHHLHPFKPPSSSKPEDTAAARWHAVIDDEERGKKRSGRRLFKTRVKTPAPAPRAASGHHRHQLRHHICRQSRLVEPALFVSDFSSSVKPGFFACPTISTSPLYLTWWWWPNMLWVA